jgi:hypothetical protein
MLRNSETGMGGAAGNVGLRIAGSVMVFPRGRVRVS